MTTTQSSLAIAAELNALLSAMSSGAQLIFRDPAGLAVATANLANPPGVVVGANIVLLGLPEFATVISSAPVGDAIASVDIQNDLGQPIITGLAVQVPNNTITLLSESVTPGGQVGVIGGVVSIP